MPLSLIMVECYVAGGGSSDPCSLNKLLVQSKDWKKRKTYQAQDADASQANIAIIGCCCPLLWLGAMFPVVVVIIHVVYLQLFAKIMAFA